MPMRNPATAASSRRLFEAKAGADFRRYEIKASSEDTADVYVYDEISPWGVDAQQFARDLATITAKTINLRVNSPGGSVFDGTAIYNALKAHPAKVVTYVDGVAASIASIIALAGDEVRMASNAYFMVHNPWGVAIGDGEELRKMAAILDKITVVMAGTYAAKCGKPKAEVLDLMNAETWFTAEEALAAGFVDVIEDDAAGAKASFDLSAFSNVPKPLGDSTPPPATPEEPKTSEASETPKAPEPDTRKMRARLAFLERELAG